MATIDKGLLLSEENEWFWQQDKCFVARCRPSGPSGCGSPRRTKTTRTTEEKERGYGGTHTSVLEVGNTGGGDSSSSKAGNGESRGDGFDLHVWLCMYLWVRVRKVERVRVEREKNRRDGVVGEEEKKKKKNLEMEREGGPLLRTISAAPTIHSLLHTLTSTSAYNKAHTFIWMRCKRTNTMMRIRQNRVAYSIRILILDSNNYAAFWLGCLHSVGWTQLVACVHPGVHAVTTED